VKYKNKPRGTKARVRASKRRLGYIGTAITVAVLVSITIVSIRLIFSSLDSLPNQTVNLASELKAAIVDHLSLTTPNRTFVQTATNTLKQAGYTVDYYPSEKVTVDFYRNLPTHGYRLIVLRAHSTAAELQDEEWIEAPVCFFTSEPYSTGKYLYEQLTDQILMVSYTMPAPPYYFGITPKFVASSMKGKLQSTIVLMMGCEGLNNTKMAEAFIEKGAEVYISWKGSVSASHTDRVIINLLQRLITRKQTITEAVTGTMEEAGPDPTYESILIYHPLEVGEQTIEAIARHMETKP
jgi:hypothetical protein